VDRAFRWRLLAGNNVPRGFSRRRCLRLGPFFGVHPAQPPECYVLEARARPWRVWLAWCLHQTCRVGRECAASYATEYGDSLCARILHALRHPVAGCSMVDRLVDTVHVSVLWLFNRESYMEACWNNGARSAGCRLLRPSRACTCRIAFGPLPLWKFWARAPQLQKRTSRQGSTFLHYSLVSQLFVTIVSRLYHMIVSYTHWLFLTCLILSGSRYSEGNGTHYYDAGGPKRRRSHLRQKWHQGIRVFCMCLV